MFSKLRFATPARLAAAALISLALVACSSPEQKAQNYYARGQELLAKHDYVKAGLEFKNALQLRKNMVEAWRGLLEVERQSNNAQNLVPILRSIVELDVNDLNARLELGRLLLAANELDQAKALAKAAISLDPKNASAAALDAAVMMKQGDVEGARQEAQHARELDPKNAEALVVLAADRMKQNDLHGALSILETDAAAHDDDLGIQLFKLVLFEKLEDTQQIESQLKKLVAQHPRERRFRRALISFYVNHKMLEEAERQLRAIVAADPANVDAELEVVQLLQQSKGTEAARQELVSRIRAGGQTFRYELALAEFDFSAGRVEDSVGELNKLISGKYSKEEVNSAKLALARVQLARKDANAASSLIAAVLKDDERNTDALKLRAAIRLDQSQYDAAINDLRQALNDQPRSAELMVLLASAYERSGTIDLAEKQYADAVQASNFAAPAALNYVAFLKRRGNVEHAEDILLEASRRQPTNIPILSALAEVRLQRQNWSGAQAIAEAIEKISGGQLIGEQIAAASLNGRGQFDQSIRMLESLHQTSPEAVQPVVGLVNTLLRAGKPDQAISFLQAELDKNPGNAVALVLLGSVQYQKKDLAAAAATFRTAIEKNPKNASGYVSLAQLYVAERKLDEAEKVLKTGLAQLPDSLPLHQNQAIVLEQKGQIDLAIVEYEWLLTKQPGSLIAVNNLASLLSDHRKDKESLDRAYALAQMLNKSPVPSFQDTLGWIYYLRGDAKGAMKMLETAAKALPERAVVQYHLGMAYEADGQTAKAREQFEKALKLNPDQQLATKIKTADQKARM